MNIATALRELRKCLKNGESNLDSYNKFVNYLDFPQLKSIIGNELRYNIIINYAIADEKSLLNFATGLSDDDFSFDRYEEYKNFRKNNKFDSWSEQFFKLKFGKNWEEKYKLSKNNRHNMYNVSDVAKKYSCSAQEAEKIVNNTKEKTKPSIEKFIQKYGKEVGEEKFNKLCRRHKNYLDYWLKLYPDNLQLAREKFKDYTSSASLKHVNFYLKRGYSDIEAKQLISDHQLSNAGVHRAYYDKFGLSIEEIDQIISSINTRKDSASIEFIKLRNPDLSVDEINNVYNYHNLTKSSTYRNHGFLRKDNPLINEKIAYYFAVDFFTKKSVKFMPTCPGKRGKSKEQYHVDHKFSKHEGHNNNIDPRIIGHVVNLQWLLVEKNCSKREDCSITKEKLLREYYHYEN
tara:strand:- start:18625 stop:19833 length:1209 start_codon:yes stop_codon:yes gene_type:complete